jgi:hypothetical protein
MKKNLTTEQLEMRAKTNKKILKFGCLPIFILCVFLIVVFNFTDDKKASSIKINTNMDSIVSVVNKSKDFEIKEVYYNKRDSSFNIAITNKDNVIKEHSYSIDYFNKFYGLDTINEIEGVYLFEYVKGKSFKTKDYGEPLVFESKRQTKIIEKFDKEFYDKYSKTYIPLDDYLQKTLNDPSSLEYITMDKTGYTEGVFSIEGSFRAKNGLGALVVNNVTCNIDINGNISNVQVTQ